MALAGVSEARESSSASGAHSSKSPSISGTTVLKQGGNKLMSKFFGNKFATTKEDSFEVPFEELIKEHSVSRIEDHNDPQVEENTEIPPELEEFPPGLITPCPFIKPLQHKLQARSEPMPRPKLKARSLDTLNSQSSALAIARNREEANRILNGAATIEYMKDSLADKSTADSVAGQSIISDITDLATGYLEGGEEDIEARIFRQLEYVATTAAEDKDGIQHWRYYIRCYSMGQFNINGPPQPPPHSLGFRYLPALFPPEEEIRMNVSRSYDILWPQWSREKAGALVCAAMKEFDTEFASLSFFDSKYELFKAEMGYNTSRISRSVSIAAHALLSSDVLVLLDTKQDWRFATNPLVYKEPKIRFFAGTPMLSPGGHAVGVFAIFGKKPRTTFTLAERRELVEYGEMALKDLTQQLRLLSDPDLRSPRTTPLLQRDSIINGVDHALVPSGLRYHKVKTPPTNTPRVFIDGHLSPDVLSQQTPPSSSEGSEDDTFHGTRRGPRKNHMQLSVNSDLNHVTSCGDMITPDSEGFAAYSHRPFSDSDLTSFHPQPPNTPELLSQDNSLQSTSDLTVENFMALSDNDCAEQESPLIDLSTPIELSNNSNINERQNLGLRLSSRLTVSSTSTMMTGQFRQPKDQMAEAAISCSLRAQNLGYDLFYIVDITPSMPLFTEKNLFAPGGVQMKFLVAYGLDRRVQLSPEMHIQVLRSRGFEKWENAEATHENGDYQVGYLIPLQAATKNASSGLVFGAFKRPKLIEVADVFRTTKEEMDKLLDAANSLKAILFKQPSMHRQPKKSNADPKSRDQYIANEAAEEERHLLDITPDRYPAGEAVEVGEQSFANTEPLEPCLAKEIVEGVERLVEIPNGFPAGEAVEVGNYPFTIANPVSPKRILTKKLVKVGKFSFDSRKPTNEPPSPERKPVVKPTTAGNKFPLDAGMDRPFHSISRFRAF